MQPTSWDIGSREAIDITLHRLARKGTIRRLARGVYDYPKDHPEAWSGFLHPPTPWPRLWLAETAHACSPGMDAPDLP